MTSHPSQEAVPTAAEDPAAAGSRDLGNADSPRQPADGPIIYVPYDYVEPIRVIPGGSSAPGWADPHDIRCTKAGALVYVIDPQTDATFLSPYIQFQTKDGSPVPSDYWPHADFTLQTPNSSHPRRLVMANHHANTATWSYRILTSAGGVDPSIDNQPGAVGGDTP